MEQFNRQVLYLEDDPEDGQFLKTMLEEMPGQGFEVTVCDSPHSAMMALSMQVYDVVFCDYVLRTEAGVETAGPFVEQVLKYFPLTPLIVTSGVERATMQPELQARMEHGSIGYLQKSSWRPDRLAGKISEVQRIVERRGRAAEGNLRPQNAGGAIERPSIR